HPLTPGHPQMDRDRTLIRAGERQFRFFDDHAMTDGRGLERGSEQRLQVSMAHPGMQTTVLGHDRVEAVSSLGMPTERKASVLGLQGKIDSPLLVAHLPTHD